MRSFRCPSRGVAACTLSRWSGPGFAFSFRNFDVQNTKRHLYPTAPTHGTSLSNRFTSGRWLWNEQEQLSRRHVNFYLSALLRLAASAVGSKSCIHVLKLSEGQYNKVFQITMDDGKEVITKLPNPNAGTPHFATASEVATMHFVYSHRHFIPLTCTDRVS